MPLNVTNKQTNNKKQQNTIQEVWIFGSRPPPYLPNIWHWQSQCVPIFPLERGKNLPQWNIIVKLNYVWETVKTYLYFVLFDRVLKIYKIMKHNHETTVQLKTRSSAICWQLLTCFFHIQSHCFLYTLRL